MGVISHNMMNQPQLKTNRLSYTNDANDTSNNLVNVTDDINNTPLFFDDTVERQMSYLVAEDNLYFYTTHSQYDIIDIYIVICTLLLFAYFIFRSLIFIDYKKS